MHVFNRLATSVQNFILIALKLWEELFTPTFLSRDGQSDGQTETNRRIGTNIMPPTIVTGAYSKMGFTLEGKNLLLKEANSSLLFKC